MLSDTFERLATWATSDTFERDLSEARARFFEATGPVHEEDASFEARMSAFSEYYLFDHVLGSDPQRRRPVERFLDEHPELSAEARGIYEGLCRTRSGLFEVRRLGHEDLKVRDLLTAEDLLVHERRRLAGVEKGDVVQTRLVPYGDHLVFGRAFLYHPREVTRLLRKAAKVRRKAGALEEPADRDRFLALLARTLLSAERMRSKNLAPTDVRRIYRLALEV